MKKEQEKIIVLLDKLTDEERQEIFSEYCECCGRKDPQCQCSNDK